MEREVIADTKADISRSVRALATPKYQSISAITAEPITDSTNVTPIVIAKLIARSSIGHDIWRSPLSCLAIHRRAERPIPLQPDHAPAPGTPAESADLSIDAIAAKTSRSDASESDCPRPILRRRGRSRTACARHKRASGECRFSAPRQESYRLGAHRSCARRSRSALRPAARPLL